MWYIAGILQNGLPLQGDILSPSPALSVSSSPPRIVTASSMLRSSVLSPDLVEENARVAAGVKSLESPVVPVISAGDSLLSQAIAAHQGMCMKVVSLLYRFVASEV
jgi:hypothetical protein